MRTLQVILFSIILAILVTSCAVVGLNVSRSTPRKPFKYPAFTQKDSLRGSLNRYRSCFDVKFYNLSVNVDINKNYITGQVDLLFNAVSKFDTLQLDLYKNMKINKITYNNTTLDYYRKYNAVFIIMAKTIQKGQTCTLTVNYEGKPLAAVRPPWEGGFVWSNDKNGKPWVGVTCEVDGASLWWPLKDHLSDEPDSMHINITVPKGLYCVCNGHLTDSIAANEQVTYKWRVTYPINSYDATLYIGDYRHFSIPYKGLDTSFNLDFYVLPYNLEKAKEQFKQTVEILKTYEKYFGAYPWPRDGYKLVESPYEGMEHQTAIAYGNGYQNSFNMFDYIILHETAHEWWGNSVTVPDYAQVWIHEGFATYSEALYVESTKGHTAYLNYMDYYSWLIRNKRPVVGPMDVNYWDYRDGDVYFKGAFVLHTLRNAINNDTIFFDIIKSFYNQFKYKIATSTDFINLVNKKTGSDYNWFFKQYLYDRTCPMLVYKFSYVSGSSANTLYFKWSNIANDFPLPVKVESNGQTFLIYPSDEWQRINLPVNLTEIYINPDNSYIASKRVKTIEE